MPGADAGFCAGKCASLSRGGIHAGGQAFHGGIPEGCPGGPGSGVGLYQYRHRKRGERQSEREGSSFHGGKACGKDAQEFGLRDSGAAGRMGAHHFRRGGGICESGLPAHGAGRQAEGKRACPDGGGCEYGRTECERSGEHGQRCADPGAQGGRAGVCGDAGRLGGGIHRRPGGVCVFRLCDGGGKA